MKKKVNIVLQGKGGVGKSTISTMLAQYYRENLGDGEKLMCFDTDPVNATFASYKGLGVDVQHVNIFTDNSVNPQAFDDLMETIIKNPDCNFVIDNGSTSFLTLSSYLYDNDVIKLLESMNFEIVIHTVVTGGQALKDTLQGVNTLATELLSDNKSTSLVVWLNEFFGKIEAEGKTFPEMNVYKKNKKLITGLITIQEQKELFKKDVQQMFENKHTFAEVQASSDYSFMSKNRLNLYKTTLFDRIGLVIT